ncbi:MAG: hypothetical protein QOF72_1082 [Blastocatellia bacterium]|jgi:hypothetical protein|nr:hypothetical protein [Blastocatellia bacterium]
MLPERARDANSLQLWEILQSPNPGGGIDSLNCLSETRYYSTTLSLREGKFPEQIRNNNGERIIARKDLLVRALAHTGGKNSR